ncbi:hypothetical protein SK571_03825 [Lentzea sp. BCCO 10_0798]|uniref:Uncharacterized protein n=1 Tax=Lentzea kristufekii TaxID=3095430 RepID=A0ABU4TJS1_9PSEU|nr:hypothetical protein [Lentzea sp. BCCO 10_0798]MDX8048500.1 hypothetical protein [Lentzea sp. BCCO 10_0798]
MRLSIALANVVVVAGSSGAAADVPAVIYQDIVPRVRKFQSIADQNGGNRAHETCPGFAASIDHVKSTRDAEGFVTRVDVFEQSGAVGCNLVSDWLGEDENHVLRLGAHLDGGSRRAGYERLGIHRRAAPLCLARDHRQGGDRAWTR